MNTDARTYKVGAFLEGGGNKIFFSDGVLDVLKREGIQIEYLVGLSSSSPVLLAYIVGQNGAIPGQFAEKLNHNEQNFYFFRRPHFPHDKIYEDAVLSLVRDFLAHGDYGHFAILGAKTSSRFAAAKAFLASVAFILKDGLGLDVLKNFRRVFNISEVRMTEKEKLSDTELTNFIMGSSTIYPFIGVRPTQDSLILDGGLLEADPQVELANCEKKIVIHTKRGVTSRDGDTFHIYADQPIPPNVLDYTNGEAVLRLYTLGTTVMTQHLPLLKEFIQG